MTERIDPPSPRETAETVNPKWQPPILRTTAGTRIVDEWHYLDGEGDQIDRIGVARMVEAVETEAVAVAALRAVPEPVSPSRDSREALTELREALGRYGRHERGCAIYWPQDGGCTCGFNLVIGRLVALADEQRDTLDAAGLAAELRRLASELDSNADWRGDRAKVAVAAMQSVAGSLNALAARLKGEKP